MTSKASVSGIIIKNSKVLLVKRNFQPYRFNWSFPSGYVNDNENPSEAIIREIFEETSVTVSNCRKFKYIPKLKHTIFICKYASGNPKPSIENIESKFMKISNAMQHKLAFNGSSILKKVIKKFNLNHQN